MNKKLQEKKQRMIIKKKKTSLEKLRKN